MTAKTVQEFARFENSGNQFATGRREWLKASHLSKICRPARWQRFDTAHSIVLKSRQLHFGRQTRHTFTGKAKRRFGEPTRNHYDSESIITESENLLSRIIKFQHRANHAVEFTKLCGSSARIRVIDR